MELRRPAHVAQASRALLDRLQPELVAVEGARPLEVRGGELGGDLVICSVGRAERLDERDRFLVSLSRLRRRELLTDARDEAQSLEPRRSEGRRNARRCRRTAWRS